MSEAHIPVLRNEVLAALLENQPVERIIDGTLGAGGHTRALVESGVHQVLGLDLDPQALEAARQVLAPYMPKRVHVVQCSYAQMDEAARRLNWKQVDGILLDLGVSSMQLDTPERGFAFRHGGPLNMRFNSQGEGITAADVVNAWDEDSLIELFFKYGEERYSRRIARAIVRYRPFETTDQLARVVAEAAPHPRKQKNQQTSSIHPATRIFQAIRIAVNDELRTIEYTLPLAIKLLRPGGRLAVISFHSLEDRIVKQVFRDAATEIVSPPGMMLKEKSAEVRLVNKKPILPGEEEIANNPRSRSAKLRVVERI